MPYAFAYGEENIYYMGVDVQPQVGPDLWSDMGLYIPYISIQDNDIRKKSSEMDVSYDPYRFLYDTYGGERKKFHSFIMIARQFTDEFYENEEEEDKIFNHK